MKQVVFNVGGALSSYIEFDDKKVLVDLGKSTEFNPILDFLKPLFTNLNSEKKDEKYFINQLIISHPHKDHMSAIQDFGQYFTAELITTPNDNEGMEEGEDVNWDLVDNDNDNDESLITLRELIKDRNPPLRTASEENQFLFYLNPEDVEDDDNLCSESYINNISLVSLFIINDYYVLLPGDIQKQGMEDLIKTEARFRRRLKRKGIDVLVASHHGLKSSFSEKLFKTMKNNKTRCINIISEKANTDDNRIVDSRYSSADYCSGENSLSTQEEKHYQVRTSRGHIFIDYSNKSSLKVEIINDVDDLINKFL